MAVGDGSSEFMSELRARRLGGNGTAAGHVPPDLLVATTMLVISRTACCRSVLMFACRIHTSSVVAGLTSACSPSSETSASRWIGHSASLWSVSYAWSLSSRYRIIVSCYHHDHAMIVSSCSCTWGKFLTCSFSAHPPHQRTFARVNRCPTGAYMYRYWAPPRRYVCVVNFLPVDTVIFAPDTASSIQFCTASWDSGSRGWIIPAAPITGNM
jgi:hypothetical protein